MVIGLGARHVSRAMSQAKGAVRACEFTGPKGVTMYIR